MREDGQLQLRELERGYIQFWLLDPFLDPDNKNTEGGDLYFNFGEISEDILKDGMKSYENGMPVDGNEGGSHRRCGGACPVRIH